MHDPLQDHPVSERPRMMGALPRGWIFFRTWRTLRWFLLLALPSIASAVAVWMRGHGYLQAAGLWLLGFAVAILIFVFCCSGMSSSNTGTYFRQTEPVRFWSEVVLLSIVYVALCCGGFLWR